MIKTDESITVAMVLAMDRNKLIGAAGGLPWHLPSELQYFKSVTMGKPLIMGRLTFESIGRPLPGRTSIVVTRTTDWLSPTGNEAGKDWAAKGVLAADTLEGALAVAENVVSAAAVDEDSDGASSSEVAIIGGASLCRDAMHLTDRLYLTVIDHEFEGDTWFDSFDADRWREVSSIAKTVDGYNLEYKVLERPSR